MCRIVRSKDRLRYNPQSSSCCTSQAGEGGTKGANGLNRFPNSRHFVVSDIGEVITSRHHVRNRSWVGDAFKRVHAIGGALCVGLTFRTAHENFNRPQNFT
jgi:hypothetical protein